MRVAAEAAVFVGGKDLRYPSGVDYEVRSGDLIPRNEDRSKFGDLCWGSPTSGNYHGALGPGWGVGSSDIQSENFTIRV